MWKDGYWKGPLINGYPADYYKDGDFKFPWEGTKVMNTNTCDHGHSGRFEVHLLPIGGGGNLILCKGHYFKEMEYRRERNKELGSAGQFDVPAWETLKVYEAD